MTMSSQVKSSKNQVSDNDILLILGTYNLILEPTAGGMLC